MKMSVKGNINVDLEFELNDFEDELFKSYNNSNVKKYDFKNEALLPIIKYFNKMVLYFQKNNKLPNRRQEFFVYSQEDVNFILSQVIDQSIVRVRKYPDFEQCFWLTLCVPNK